MMKIPFFLPALFFLLLPFDSLAQKPGKVSWSDSVFQTLSQEEKIAQLFMVAAFSAKDQENIKEIEVLVRQCRVGGLIFFKGNPHREAQLTNYYQSISKTPLLIGMDAEWGLAMRLDSVPSFPRQMPLGAMENDSLIYLMGAEIARECKRLGIHINFAPVIDVNSNPNNPVINDRSFGENKQLVTRKGLAYMQGMQDNGVMACAKHFPGHGDTETDSHFDLPVINASRERLDTLELFPFRELFAKGVKSVMLAHLYLPAIDTTSNTASSLSKAMVTDLLENEMHYDGLKFTDALNMRGVTKFFAPGEVDLRALMAGNDILLFPENVPAAIEKIKVAVDSGRITQEFLDNKVKKILAAKEWAGLNRYQPVKVENAASDIYSPEAQRIINQILQQSIFVIKNEDGLFPVKPEKHQKIASVAIGYPNPVLFQQTLSNYAQIDYFFIDREASAAGFDSLYKQVKDYDLLIASLHNTHRSVSKGYGLRKAEVDFINMLNEKKKTAFVFFANPYALQQFPGIKNLMIAYDDQVAQNEQAAQMVFGANASRAKLPVTVSAEYAYGSGLFIVPSGRLRYVTPLEIGIKPEKLRNVDTLINKAIRDKAMPGCQVLAAKDGSVFYSRSFGTVSYLDTTPVSNRHIYDLASITKVAATTLAVMKLQEEGKINLDAKLSSYLKKTRRTNKGGLIIRDILTHRAGLTDWIPFYKSTIYLDGTLDTLVYRRNEEKDFTLKVADSLYIHKHYPDEIWKRLLQSELKQKGEYRYSDLGFIIMKRVVEEVSGMKLDEYLDKNFYRPLGMHTATFNPMEKYDKKLLIPTENDTQFRKQLVHGYVHDPAAAMMGGISGHAGLFSRANDLAILLQMLMNKGTYGGVQYLKPETVTLFTSTQFPGNRRGLGFDKPETDPNKGSGAGRNASFLAFGHTGFTGTCFWADPQSGLIYIFLSNRVNPSAENNKLIKQNIRTEIHDAFYKALK
jgi:beta-N-acetylhexosaminidase